MKFLFRDNYSLGKLEKKICNVDLLILDEMGYVSFDRYQSELLFKVIVDRSERGSTIVTTNLAFSEWTTLFENTAMVAALVDRLTFRLTFIATPINTGFLEMIKVLFICHGNICRSPISEFVLKDMVEKRGIQDQFEIASAATSTEEIWGGKGNAIYPPAQAVLREHGIGKTAYTNFSGKRARQVTRADYEHYDYLLCADSANVRNTVYITGGDREGKIKLLLDFTDRPGRSIADPWYTDRFDETYRDVVEGCTAFLDELERKGLIPSAT